MENGGKKEERKYFKKIFFPTWIFFFSSLVPIGTLDQTRPDQTRAYPSKEKRKKKETKKEKSVKSMSIGYQKIICTKPIRFTLRGNLLSNSSVDPLPVPDLWTRRFPWKALGGYTCDTFKALKRPSGLTSYMPRGERRSLVLRLEMPLS
jgi:hypothetical protein